MAIVTTSVIDVSVVVAVDSASMDDVFAHVAGDSVTTDIVDTIASSVAVYMEIVTSLSKRGEVVEENGIPFMTRTITLVREIYILVSEVSGIFILDAT